MRYKFDLTEIYLHQNEDFCKGRKIHINIFVLWESISKHK